MHAYQREFIQFAIERGVLCFGEFELKSGRISPYFFNAGGFNTGAALARLGRYYAAAIQQAELDFDVMLGPAYKGIPLVSAASIALANDYERDVPYVFNRKVAKDHGEGGNLVGAALAGRVLIVDDVISAGTAIREVMTLINDAGAKPSAVVIALNRQERGTGDVSAIQQVEDDYGIPVASIVGFAELVEYLEEVGGYERHLEAMYEYRRQYGV